MPSFIQDNVTISKDCTNGQGTSYELFYTTDSGTLNTTCVVDGTECSNGLCSHNLQNNTADSRCQPPVSQFSDESLTVFLTARNIVGRNNSAVSRRISESSLFIATSQKLCSIYVLMRRGNGQNIFYAVGDLA